MGLYTNGVPQLKKILSREEIEDEMGRKIAIN